MNLNVSTGVNAATFPKIDYEKDVDVKIDQFMDEAKRHQARWHQCLYEFLCELDALPGAPGIFKKYKAGYYEKDGVPRIGLEFPEKRP